MTKSYTVYTINALFAVHYLLTLVVLSSDVNTEEPSAYLQAIYPKIRNSFYLDIVIVYVQLSYLQRER